MGITLGNRTVKQFKMRLVKDSLLESSRLPVDDELEFSEIPSKLILNRTATYNNIRVPGRSEPWKAYSDSNPSAFEFSAKLVALGGSRDPNPVVRITGGALGLTGRFVPKTAPFLGITGNAVSLVSNAAFNGQTEDVIAITFEEVHRKVAWLEALTYPQHDEQGHVYPPPLVYLIYGQNFRRRGVVRSVTFEYEGPWEINTLLSMVVNCSISFEEVNVSPKSYLDARNRSSAEAAESADENTFDKVRRRTVDYARSIFGI